MKKLNYIFLVFFTSLCCNSQISGTIYGELNLPVENVSVFLLKNNDTLNTVLSNKNGVFEFKNILETEDVELIMSHISYETLMTKLTEEKTYFLIPKQYFIEGVSVTSQKKEKKHTINRILNTVFYGSIHVSYDCELAVFIPATDKNKEKKIKSIKYQLTDLSGEMKNNKYQPFRACIYTVDTITKKPKEKIYRSEKVRMTKNEKWFYVHIDSLNITMPEAGFFIGFETITREEADNKQIGDRKGNALIDAIPTLRTKLYNPKSPNKSYTKKNIYPKEIAPWELNKHFHFCMEFEFEDN